MSKKLFTEEVIGNMTWEEKVALFKQLSDNFFKDNKRTFEKENRSAGERARRCLTEMSRLIKPLRKDILSKLKELPKKPTINNNLKRK